MAKYPLTDKQKNLLGSIVPGLKDGSIEAEWFLSYGDDSIMGIFGLNDDDDLWDKYWSKAKLSDFNAFVKAGLFEITSYDNTLNIPSAFSLNETLIIDAVENNFEVNTWFTSPTPQNITLSGDFRGSNVNIASTLQNAHQTITSSSMAENAKVQLETLLQELNHALQEIPSDQEEDAEAVAEHAKAAVDQLASSKPNKRIIRVNLEGLKTAAEAVKNVAPNVLSTALQIVSMIAPYLQ